MKLQKLFIYFHLTTLLGESQESEEAARHQGQALQQGALLREGSAAQEVQGVRREGHTDCRGQGLNSIEALISLTKMRQKLLEGTF